MPDTVSILVPIKSPRYAKSRLRRFLGEGATESLAWAMVRHTLRTLRSIELIYEIYVLTDDAAVAAYSVRQGCQALRDVEGLTLAQNLDIAAKRIDERQRAGLLVLAGDLPLLTEARLIALLDKHDRDVTIVAARRDNGTTAILCSVGRLVPFQFEKKNSAAAHRNVSHVIGYRSQIINVPGLDFDLDMPADLDSRHIVDWPAELRPYVRLARRSVRCHA